MNYKKLEIGKNFQPEKIINSKKFGVNCGLRKTVSWGKL